MTPIFFYYLTSVSLQLDSTQSTEQLQYQPTTVNTCVKIVLRSKVFTVSEHKKQAENGVSSGGKQFHYMRKQLNKSCFRSQYTQIIVISLLLTSGQLKATFFILLAEQTNLILLVDFTLTP